LAVAAARSADLYGIPTRRKNKKAAGPAGLLAIDPVRQLSLGLQEGEETLTVLIATQLVFAHHLQHGPSFCQVFVLSLQGNKQRLLFGQLSFSYNYVSFHSGQLRHNGFSVHYVTAATCEFVNYISL
jgi:hypothetical protein